jgi:hypothetical protein
MEACALVFQPKNGSEIIGLLKYRPTTFSGSFQIVEGEWLQAYEWPI